MSVLNVAYQLVTQSLETISASFRQQILVSPRSQLHQQLQQPPPIRTIQLTLQFQIVLQLIQHILQIQIQPTVLLQDVQLWRVDVVLQTQVGTTQ